MWHDADITDSLHTVLTELLSHDDQSSTNSTSHDAKCLAEASNILRMTLEKIDNEYRTEPDLTKLNFNEIILTIDPLVWNFFFQLTLTNAEILYLRNKDFDWNVTSNDKIFQNQQTQTAKTMARLSLIACCIYNINNGTTFPLSLLVLADVIDKYTNSSADCLQFCNMFGLCTYYDTLRRHQAKIAILRMDTKQSILLNNNSFTYVSIDNVSFWASNARVRSSDTERGLNCTSYMSCQPKPQSVLLTEEEICSIPSKLFKDNQRKEYNCPDILCKSSDTFFLSCLYNVDHAMQTCIRDQFGKPKAICDQN